MAREPRFPGIDWYCDKCGALLNSQKNFDDHKYTWKCRNCGYKNSISRDNISAGDSLSTKCLLHLLGFLSFTGLWTSIMLLISIFVFKADHNLYFRPLVVSIAIYIISFIIELFVEYGIRHKTISVKNTVYIFLRNLKEELLCPFMAVKEIISNILSLITRIIPVKREYVWHSNLTIISFAIIYIALFTVEIIAFNKINHFTANDWHNLFQRGYDVIQGLFIK